LLVVFDVLRFFMGYAYMAALEEASVHQNIAPFTDFLSQLVKEGLRGKPVAKVPHG
jgi:hypothetical protein